ncbi:toll/interleukin-1 receptor domain-containing protein [Microbacterium sp. Clip185]|uniref:toll/interleukin-1 receptor domain-containing protein n=1 Tax=Microbacterium sp. Clip185 TaxID=3025663 RepID=UPI0023654B46|nr:TIR domain-containing protein [Microbacterium sp. Clip185]WDG17481.1 TIR domain-containing protein [Microbacterium sp. Clip185]
MDQTRDYDVAVSFAGENRAYVQETVAALQQAGHRVFYDEDNEVDMWGRDLTEYFSDLYENRARFALMFVSAHYARKQWTTLERRTILARALDQVTPYVLPVRLDDTILPGLRSTIAYIDGTRRSPADIAAAVGQKLGAPDNSGRLRSTGQVPLNEHEATLLLGERPGAWEYAYFAWRLREELRKHDSAYNDLRIGYVATAEYIADADLLSYLSGEISRNNATIKRLESMLQGDAQKDAFRYSGGPGDPKMIEHLAARMTDLWRQQVDWASGLQAKAYESNQGREALLAVADIARHPIIDYRNFVELYAAEANRIQEAVLRGESVNARLPLKLTVPEEVNRRVDRALRAFGRRFR